MIIHITLTLFSVSSILSLFSLVVVLISISRFVVTIIAIVTKVFPAVCVITSAFAVAALFVIAVSNAAVLLFIVLCSVVDVPLPIIVSAIAIKRIESAKNINIKKEERGVGRQ
jgi:hypothetical protein